MLLIVTDCHQLLKNNTKYNNVNISTFSGNLIIMWRSKWCKHIHGAMKMFFMKHTSYSSNINSKNTTFIPTWHFLFNILIFFIPIYFSILSFSMWPFYFYKSSAEVSVFLTNKAIVLCFIISKILVYIFNIFYLTNPWNSMEKSFSHTKCVTLLVFLTTYFTGNFFWKEIFHW